MTSTLVVALLLAAGPAAAWAQAPPPHPPSHAPSHSPLHSPYGRDAEGAIRGLSPREVEDLQEGRGMGLARAAELNGYPGPRHVLDAAETGALPLAPEQLLAVHRLHAAMATDARRLGEAVLAEERGLEAGFRAGRVAEADLSARLTRIAALQAELRGVHLRAHVATRAVLTDPQVARYRELRGYAGPGGAAPGHAHP